MAAAGAPSETSACGRGLTWLERRQQDAAHLAEADTHRTRLLAPTADDDGIAVFEKSAPLIFPKLDGFGAASTEFQQRARLLRGRPGLSAGAEQIARGQIAAVDRMMRDELPDRPIGMPKAGRGQTLRRISALAHCRRLEPGLEPDVDGAGVPIRLRIKVAQGLGVPLGPRARQPEGGKGLQTDDPRRNSRGEVLCQKGTQRLVLPGLQVSSGPVVEQAHAEYMRLRIGQRNRAAKGVAGTEEDAQFQLEVHARARADDGRRDRKSVV